MSGISNLQAAAPVRVDPFLRAPERSERQLVAPVEERGLSDSVELSAEALRAGGVRPEVIERVRGQLEAGGYLTDEKLDRALDALLDDVFGPEAP